MMRNFVSFTILFWGIFISGVFAQPTSLAQFERAVKMSYQKSYPATVRIFKIDSVDGSWRSSGSGVVVGSDGLILTVAHINETGQRFGIRFPDGREVTARGLGEFSFLDAAMMQIEDKGPFPVAVLGRSANLQVGQPCISLGYAGSLRSNNPTLRLGFVINPPSGRRRPSVQTSCLMEPGDSGGPVFDLNGRIIGLRSRITQPLDANFDVPIDVYLQYWDALLVSEQGRRPPEGAQKKLAGVSAISPGEPYIPYCDTSSVMISYGEQLPTRSYRIISEMDGVAIEAIGTLLDLDGFLSKKAMRHQTFLLSKSSIVGDTPAIIISEKETLNGQVIVRDEARDLVLLAFSAKKRTGTVDLSDLFNQVTQERVGSFIYSVLPDKKYRVSVVGAIPFSIDGQSRAGYLGATLEQQEDGLYFSRIRDNSPAKAAGLEVGQKIISVDGVVPQSPKDFVTLIQRKQPKDTIRIACIQQEEERVKNLVLTTRPLANSTHSAEHFEGGKSVIRDGFDRVFVHDARIQPEECGSPVVDMSGRFYGINIARISRTSTLVMPVDEIKLFLEEITEKAKEQQLKGV